MIFFCKKKLFNFFLTTASETTNATTSTNTTSQGYLGSDTKDISFDTLNKEETGTLLFFVLYFYITYFSSKRNILNKKVLKRGGE